MKKYKDFIFFTVLFSYLLVIFENAFSIKFYGDDYFFLKLSKINSAADFFNFFDPQKTYFYRPLTTEVFYFLLHFFKENTYIGHTFVFLIFFVGLVFLFKSIYKISRDRLFSYLTTAMYAVSFTHVYQLYVFNTYQEIGLFTALCISFYAFLANKRFLSFLFFVLALMSKETAILFPIFLILYEFFIQKKPASFIKNVKTLLPYVLISILFGYIYKNGIESVAQLETYKLQWHPKLMLNSFIWYFLWSLGFPSFLPDYLPSFTSSPIQAFWKNLTNLNFSLYFFTLIAYLGTIVLLGVFALFNFKKIKRVSSYFAFFILSFILFVITVLPIIHKWMVRLTLPLIFIILIEAGLLYIILKLNKKINYVVLLIMALFLFWNFNGIKVHEQSSTYLLETKIFNNARRYFNTHKNEVIKHEVIYFKDTTHNLAKGWNGSEKLITSFNDQYFLDYFFPNSNIKAVYGFKSKKIPKKAYVVDSNIFLK